MKQESRDIRRPHLRNEYEVVKYLQKGCSGVARVIHFQTINGFQYMVMDCKGPNLTELFNICGKHLSSRCLAHICIQMLPVFRYIHAHGILHRDLKPENICVGRWPVDCRNIYLIDFGLAKQFIYRDENGRKKHIPKRNPENKSRSSLTGTVRYSSVSSHYGDQGRRDDLESFGHVIIYLLKGAWLPWMGIQAQTKAKKYDQILKLKVGSNMKALLQKNHREFRIYMDSIRKMTYTEKPDYDFYIRLFEGLLKRKGWDPKSPLDWEKDEYVSQTWPPGT